MSWFPLLGLRHLSLHLSIRGDEVRVRSCLIFRYRILPKKQCILEKHSNLLQEYNSCRLLLTITHKYLSSHETRKHRHIFSRVAAFWQRVFQTLPNLDVHPGVAVYHTLKIFSIVNAKDLLMPHTKFQVCTLRINTIFCHRKKKSHYFWTGVYKTYGNLVIFCQFRLGRTANHVQVMICTPKNPFVSDKPLNTRYFPWQENSVSWRHTAPYID